MSNLTPDAASWQRGCRHLLEKHAQGGVCHRGAKGHCVSLTTTRCQADTVDGAGTIEHDARYAPAVDVLAAHSGEAVKPWC